MDLKTLCEDIVDSEVLNGYDSYIKFEDTKQAYKDFLEGMKPYYKINTTNNELLSESELRTIRYREVFSIEINVNSRGHVDKLRFRELKSR